MSIWGTILLLLAGLVLIIKGGDWFVDAASWTAEVSGVPKLIVGATVVSVATTLPELLVSVLAALKGNVDMAIGNAVGSVTANIGLIMAMSLIFLPFVIKRSDYLFKSLMMIGSAVLIGVFSIFFNRIAIVPAIIIFAVFIVYIFENVSAAKKAIKDGAKDSRRKIEGGKKEIIKNVVMFIIGAAAIVFGADLLVDNGTIIAEHFGVPHRIISLTIIAVGTSLPELVTTVTAIVKKQTSLGVGNIIGANVLDLSMIMPVCAFISGGALPISSRSFATFDIPVCLLMCVFATVPALITKKFSRWQGAVLMMFYAVYLVILCSGTL